jgi:hypothetical protein
MSKYVDWGGKIVPRSAVKPMEPIEAGTCGRCGGLGAVPEQIDDDRHDVMVPCYACQVFCKACGKYRTKPHECPKQAAP